MHEMSLVRSLLRQVNEIAAQEQAVGEVVKVHVSIGPLSGVEPLLVRSAYDQLATSAGLGQAELAIEECPLLGVCRDCGESIQIEDFDFRCSACDSVAIRVTSGDAFRLLRLTLRDRRPEPKGGKIVSETCCAKPAKGELLARGTGHCFPADPNSPEASR